MILRPGKIEDFNIIKDLYNEYSCTLDFKHLENLIVVEEDGEIIAVGVITRLLEGAFLASKSISKKKRIIALNKLVGVAENLVRRLGFDSFHAFSTNEQIHKFLQKHFGFKETDGKSLIKWVN